MSSVSDLPKISIAMPVWNGEAHLEEAINSILCQSFTDFEFLVIDDGSSDQTLDILSCYAASDSRIKIHQRAHGGITSALNYAIDIAASEWIARFDADDIAHPTWLEKLWLAQLRHPEAVLFQVGTQNFGAVSRKQPLKSTNRSLYALKLCFLSPIAHPSTMYRKSAMIAAGKYSPDDRHTEDYGAWGRLLEQGEFVAIPEILASLRVHPVSTSQRNLETQRSQSRRIAIQNCKKFMALSDADAERAFATLAKLPTTDYRDWLWFSLNCLPRLKWLDGKTVWWTLLRTGRAFFRKRRVPAASEPPAKATA